MMVKKPEGTVTKSVFLSHSLELLQLMEQVKEFKKVYKGES